MIFQWVPRRFSVIQFGVVACLLFSIETTAISMEKTAKESSPLRLTDKVAEQWAELVLQGVDTQYPNKLSLVYSSDAQIKTPKEHFPAFYGCFDWHSSVHGHWVLVRLLRDHPTISSASRIREVLKRHLSKDNLAAEADFFSRDEQKTFERMYGWAWFLRLVMELDSWEDTDARQWRIHLQPLESVLVDRIEAYLPKLTYPIRIGQHTDTAFALGQILDYAQQMDKKKLHELVANRARNFYVGDLDYPVHYEPSGHDFFSSCWNEADLMRRVLNQQEFTTWLSKFLPKLSMQLTDGTISPVSVSDVTDPKIVHLAGLNLHRAWCLQSVAAALPVDQASCELLEKSASKHLNAGLKYINSGHYEGDHWLATFGLYAIKRVGVSRASD